MPDDTLVKGSILTPFLRLYIEKAGIKTTGSCHLFRHAMATHMLDNGADIRFIQMMLGHADLSTTQIYTQVSIEKLKAVHAATHPAKLEHEPKLNITDSATEKVFFTALAEETTAEQLS